MSIFGTVKAQIGSMVESRVRRVFQQAGRHDSAPDDPFLRIQGMIKHESGLLQDLIIKSNDRLDAWEQAGYSVYSQFDEDGLIQHLIRKVKIDRDHFVEIGIEDYRQSNTRFLLEKNDWTGHVMDCVDGAISFMDTYDLRTSHTIEFTRTLVTTENINTLLACEGEIGLFSLDIDSMDYYVFEKMEARPSIVILEFAAVFGPTADVSVPFSETFDRHRYHYSGLCAGASLAAMTRLAQAKGYSLVGCSKGQNAFYVRNDCLNGHPIKSSEEAISKGRYRDSRGLQNEFTFVSGIEQRREIIRDAIVYDFSVNRERTVAEVFGL